MDIKNLCPFCSQKVKKTFFEIKMSIKIYPILVAAFTKKKETCFWPKMTKKE